MTPSFRKTIFFALPLLAAIVAAASSSCSSSSSQVGLATTCAINSDCNSPLICAFAKCHGACHESRDCATGERCVKAGTSGVCQLPAESTCGAASASCQSGQVCGTDQQCRVQCTSAGGCVAGDYCLVTAAAGACYSATSSADEPALMAAGILAADGAVIGDASSVVMAPDGFGGTSGPDGSSAPDSGTADGGPNSKDSGGVVGNACPSAQTQVGGIAQGDTNQYFASGVGLRTKDQLLIFNDYHGPDPVGDAGTVNYVYVQAFDPVTGNGRGPAQPFLPITTQDAPASAATLMTAAIAPTGEIALLYSDGDPKTAHTDLYVSFLAAAPDAGASPANLQLAKTVVLEVGNLCSQPQSIWSTASKAFVFSWKYGNCGGPTLRVRKFLVDGRGAGGDTDSVPTDRADNVAHPYSGVDVAASGTLFGVPYINYNNRLPYLTVLDSLGNEIGSSFPLGTMTPNNWTTAGGTRSGFVVFYDLNPGTGEVFVPVDADGGVAAAHPPDGGSDAGLPGFQFSGTKQAVYGRALNDDVGGVGGVGLGILYNDGVAFAYVNSDGITHVGPTDWVAHTYVTGDYIGMSNFGGSFGISLYSYAGHATQAIASGCAP